MKANTFNSVEQKLINSWRKLVALNQDVPERNDETMEEWAKICEARVAATLAEQRQRDASAAAAFSAKRQQRQPDAASAEMRIRSKFAAAAAEKDPIKRARLYSEAAASIST